MVETKKKRMENKLKNGIDSMVALRPCSDQRLIKGFV